MDFQGQYYLCTFALWKLCDKMFTLVLNFGLIDFPKSILSNLIFIPFNYRQCLSIDSFDICRVDAHSGKSCIHVKLVYICVDNGKNEPQLIWSMICKTSLQSTRAMEWMSHSSSGL